MSSNNSKAPPPWDDDKPFQSWKSEVNLWAHITDIAPAKQGGIIGLSLSGRKPEVALEQEESVLISEDGKVRLFSKLEEEFSHETSDLLYQAYEEFEGIRRGSSAVSEYIMSFERAHAKLLSKK